MSTASLFDTHLFFTQKRDRVHHHPHPVAYYRRTLREPAALGSRIDFVRYQVPPFTSLGRPASAHASGTVEHMHVASGSVRVTVGDETAELSADNSCRLPHRMRSRTRPIGRGANLPCRRTA